MPLDLKHEEFATLTLDLDRLINLRYFAWGEGTIYDSTLNLDHTAGTSCHSNLQKFDT
jgi:hypothetical protein